MVYWANVAVRDRTLAESGTRNVFFRTGRMGQCSHVFIDRIVFFRVVSMLICFIAITFPEHYDKRLA